MQRPVQNSVVRSTMVRILYVTPPPATLGCKITTGDGVRSNLNLSNLIHEVNLQYAWRASSASQAKPSFLLFT
jgi:hypothetical protein